MPAQLTDVFLFTAPIWVVFKRLDAASKPGKKLEGLKWKREGQSSNDSTSSLPTLQPVFVEIDSKLGIGQPKDNGNHRTRANLPLFNSFVVRIRLRTDTKHGFVRADPTDPKQALGHLEWAGLVMDAIETGDDDKPDACLEQTLRGPVTFGIREPDMTTLSMESIIEVIFDGRGHQRTERGYTFPPLPPLAEDL